MKTLPISEALLRRICEHFLMMEPGRCYLVDECLEAVIYDDLVKSFPEFMEDGFREEDLDLFFEQFEDDHFAVLNF